MAKTPKPIVEPRAQDAAETAINVFDETDAATPATEAPAAGVAETPAASVAETLPENCVHVPLLGLYVVKVNDDLSRNFKTLDEVYEFLNAATIDAYTEQFMAYVEANEAAYFTVPAKDASTSKKDKVLEDGTVVPKGTVTPAKGARMMEGMALESAKTRLRSAAAKVFAWQLRNQA